MVYRDSMITAPARRQRRQRRRLRRLRRRRRRWCGKLCITGRLCALSPSGCVEMSDGRQFVFGLCRKVENKTSMKYKSANCWSTFDYRNMVMKEITFSILKIYCFWNWTRLSRWNLRPLWSVCKNIHTANIEYRTLRSCPTSKSDLPDKHPSNNMCT